MRLSHTLLIFSISLLSTSFSPKPNDKDAKAQQVKAKYNVCANDCDMNAMYINARYAKTVVGNLTLFHVPSLLESALGHDKSFDLTYKEATLLICTKLCFRELEDKLVSLYGGCTCRKCYKYGTTLALDGIRADGDYRQSSLLLKMASAIRVMWCWGRRLLHKARLMGWIGYHKNGKMSPIRSELNSFFARWNMLK